jgi:N-acetyl-1-D-myo-inositol-2-amino-2-deoxy-alpha-D-glucopyranoside deacetylase
VSTLFLVHAHPDDEAIATGGVMLRAHRDGHRVVLVTCTRGEEGEIHTLDEAEVRPRLGEVRAEELRRGGEVLGVSRQEFLGYRDSGMAGLPTNDHPESFHRAPLDEAAERLAVLLREERPEAVVTYTPDGTYGHPDHIKASRTTTAALQLLAAEGWAPGAAYQHAVLASSTRAMMERAREMGISMGDGVIPYGIADEDVTTHVLVGDLVEEKMRSFESHVSQIDPNGPWKTMAGQIAEMTFAVEHYVLVSGERGVRGTVRSLLPGPVVP